MPKSPRLAKGSAITVADQLRLYAEQLGEAKAAEQLALQNKARGKCSCEPSNKKVKGQYGQHEIRRVHTRECPKFKPWMEDLQ